MRKKNLSLLDGYRQQQRAIKVRIYPNDEQTVLLNKTFGCVRFVWNQMLSFEQEIYAAADTHFVPTPATFKEEYTFLKEVDSLALANAQINLNAAFSSFFKGKSKHPNFKSKKNTPKSYTTNCQTPKNGGNPTIEVFEHEVKLPKVGVVKATIHRKPMPGWALKGATVSQSASGKYYCSLLYEYAEPIPEEVLPEWDTTIGLDYSSPDFYVDDKGNSPMRERYFRISEEKLAKEQRKLSKMEYDSNNYKQQKLKVSKIHEHIANQRKDFCHKESRRITNSCSAVCVEDINLRDLSRSLRLGKSTLDNGFGMFRNFLEYKLRDQGKHIIVIDKWLPSSKACNRCGYINKDLKLSDRIWICPGCEELVMRDANAGLNIKKEGYNSFYGVITTR